MTRRRGDDPTEDHARERLRQFEQERGLERVDGPSEDESEEACDPETDTVGADEAEADDTDPKVIDQTY